MPAVAIALFVHFDLVLTAHQALPDPIINAKCGGAFWFGGDQLHLELLYTMLEEKGDDNRKR